MLYPPRAVAEVILKLAAQRNVSVKTETQLNWLVYLAHSLKLLREDKPLIDGAFIATPDGPKFNDIVLTRVPEDLGYDQYFVQQAIDIFLVDEGRVLTKFAIGDDSAWVRVVRMNGSVFHGAPQIPDLFIKTQLKTSDYLTQMVVCRDV
jgi:hypothetical protein